MTANEIKTAIAKKYNIPCDKVKCFHCANWAYNRGYTINSAGASRCPIYKHKTDSYQFCKSFNPIGGK